MGLGRVKTATAFHKNATLSNLNKGALVVTLITDMWVNIGGVDSMVAREDVTLHDIERAVSALGR
jgi:hypothetical protein